jgi:hypothetical protein
MRAIDAADDIRLPIQTVSHPKAFHDACRTFGPTAVLALRVIAVMSVVGPRIPLLVAGDVDISHDRALRTKVKSLGLDVRGSVRFGGSLSDLQLALLCAIAGLRGGPTA